MLSKDRFVIIGLRKFVTIEKQFGRTEYAWQANVRFPDTLLNGKRLPNCSHGLNTFSHINNMAFLSALNPTPEASRFLKNFYGLNDKQIHAAIQGEAFFQSIMRGSARDPDNHQPKHYLIPSLQDAEFLK